MIFKRIEMENFRQFRDKNSIDFSVDKSITLIIAKNGVGKTTLLQAFRYCFYGDSPNYLKLPDSKKLLNNSLKEELRETEKAPFSVTVYFEHAGIDYFATRSKTYVKKKGKIIEDNDESFILWKYDDGVGYKPLSMDESEIMMRQIMPPGLAHIYMFDGERMEKRVETSEYKNDLKEAITGILGIKKLEASINLLGSENYKTRVLGMVYENMKTNSIEEENELKAQIQLSARNEELGTRIGELKEKINVIDKKIESWRAHQKEIEANSKYVSELQRLELINRANLERRNTISQEGIALLSSLLKIKVLANVYSEYKNFVKKGDSEGEFFQSLHIDTLKDILHKERCICGECVPRGSDKYQAILDLEKHVLPYDNAHYINKINEEFQRITDYKDLKVRLEEKKKELVTLKKDIRENTNKIIAYEEKIKDFERQFGQEKPQDEIDKLRESKLNLTTELKISEDEIISNSKKLKELETKIKNIVKNNSVNKKIELALESLKRIKLSIINELRDSEERARILLERNLNLSFGYTLEGEYNANLDENFELNIQQKVISLENGESYHMVDQTRLLSTGQSVMVSLSFINALLLTLNEIRNLENVKHGVLMDAALSNVDEKHISNLCNNVLNKFDQLIFLSFKRQLRDEFYSGIGDNVGLSYIMEKNRSGNVFITRIEKMKLEEYIHSVEGGY